MTYFALFGILAYWVAMGVIGYALGYVARFALDLRQGIQRLMAPVDNAAMELEVLLKWLDKGVGKP